MKTINTILACAFASLAFSSCSGPEDKNIIEELTLDEKLEITEKNPRAETMLSRASLLRERNPMAFMEYGDVTYREFFDYLATVRDNDSTWRADAEAQYEREYADVFRRADSVFRYWQKWEVDHSLPNQIKVTPTRLHRDSDGSIYADFKIHSNLGTVYSIDLTFRLSQWSDKSTYGLWLPDSWGKILSEPFTDAEVKDLKIFPSAWADSETSLLRVKEDAPAACHDDILDDINRLPLADFIDKYGFKIDISQVSVDKGNLSTYSHTFDMPEAIGHYWRPSAKPAHDGIARFDDMKMTIIKDILHEDIPDELHYVYEYVNEKQRQINERLHDLDNLPYMSDL